MTDDAELLLRYSRDGSEEAFTTLVERHLGLVYSAAARRLNGDTHAAKDATQAVFSALARNAVRLSRRPVLAGWLHTATHYATARIIRTERRRQRHEEEAHHMSELVSEHGTPLDWQKVRPLLDDVLRELPERDRDAILLRFFEDRTFAEVGRRLEISEDGARLRVSRALDKMNAVLSRKHIASTASALGILLDQEALATAPIGLTVSIVQGALASAAAGASFGILPFIIMNKLSIGIAAAAVAAGTVGLIVHQKSEGRLNAEIARLQEEVRTADQARDREKTIAQQERTTRAAKEAEIAALKKVTLERSPTRPDPRDQPPKRSESKLAAGLKPVEPAANKGRGTPSDTIETLYSATAGGDVGIVQAGIFLDGSTREKFHAYFASLSPEKRAAYGTPEGMVATIMSTTPPVAGFRIMETDQADADHATLHMQVQYGDGRVRENDMNLQRANDGWQLVVPAEGLKKFSMIESGRTDHGAAPAHD